MVARVREVDSEFFDRFDAGAMEDMPEWKQPPHDGEAFAREFDARLAGLTSRLVDFSPRAIEAMAEAYRAVMGLTVGGMPRRGGARPDAESGAQSLSPRNAQRGRARADDAPARSRTLHVREKNQPHRG